MSMLQAQVDELRKMADRLELIDLPDMAADVREAADTIWELRGSVHRERAEADRLREELAIRKASEQEKAIEYLRQENINWEDKYRALAAENAKMRELAREIYSEYRYLRVRFHRTYVQHEGRMRAIERRMRELGVEAE